jgi:peptidoglycan/LPS O-acetylase OafA/YrhL
MNPLKTRLVFLDVARGLAILWVVSYHVVFLAYGTTHLPNQGFFPDFFNPPGGWTFYLLYPLCFGWGGVAVFFVISGFCIHISHASSEQPNWADFFRRRAWRILPPYFVALLAFAFLWQGTRLSNADVLMPRTQFVSHLLLVHNLDARTLYGINCTFWSIAVEVQLYVLYPIMLALWKRMGAGRGLLLFIGLEVVLRVASASWVHVWQTSFPHLLYFSPFSFWGSWALGAYLAERYRTGRPLVPHIGWAWGLGILSVVVCHANTFSLLGFLTIAALTFVLMARSLFRPARASLVEGSPNRRIVNWLGQHLCEAGVVSYSVYLFHYPLCDTAITLIRASLHVTAPFWLALAGLPLWWALFWVGRLLYRYVELPSAACGRRSTLLKAPLREAA